MKNMHLNTNPIQLMAVAFLSFLSLAYFVHGDGLSDVAKILLTVTSFVFGFYINNLIAQARNRHAKVVDSLREEGGYIKALYYMTEATFSKEDTKKLRDNIDNYLTASMDYKSLDYSLSAPQFRELFNHIMKMQPETKAQEVTWGHLVRISGEIQRYRTKIETLVKERVSAFEWLTLGILLSLVIYFVFSLNGGTLLSTLITACIATSLSMLIIILHGLDTLRWKEDKWFWAPLEELFLGMDLLPYYPKILLDQKRLKITPGTEVRLAEYPRPYPDISDREVHTRKF